MRHVFKPSVSFSYAPDFTSSHYGYQRTYVKTDANGEVSTVTYSPYSSGIYSYPSGTKQGMITMSVSNNVEMKVKSDRDTTGERKSASSTSSMARSPITWQQKRAPGATSTRASA